MLRHIAPVTLAVMVTTISACSDSNPITGPTTPDTTTTTTTGGTSVDTTLDSDGSISTYETYDSTTGNGFAQDISWDGTNFVVDNLAFDGANRYARDATIPTLGVAELYTGDVTYADDVTGVPIFQFEHRAAASESSSGKVRFAIVRTGSYVGYGFGGFMFERDGDVTIPTSGQAAFSGEYVGVRDFDGQGGIEYVRGIATAAVDFRDFNNGAGFRLYVTNRRVYDTSGNDITSSILSALHADNLYTDDPTDPTNNMSVLRARVGPGVINSNGEISAEMFSTVTNTAGTPGTSDDTVETYETGSFVGLIAGAGGAMELVGVSVSTAADPRWEGVTARETGGVIAVR